MAGKKPRVVIVGAGMAGITAAHRVHTCAPGLFDLSVVEAGDRIGGRILTSDFAGNRVEVGATWIHGIEGSPVYDIARTIGALQPDGLPWELMDGSPTGIVTVAEGGLPVDPDVVAAVSSLYAGIMEAVSSGRALGSGCASVGSYLRSGLGDYFASEGKRGKEKPPPLGGEWPPEALEEAVFAIRENMERTYTSADDLETLNLASECEYREFPGEQITIARGYSRVVEALAAALPAGTVRLGTKVQRIEWRPDGGGHDGPVRLRFEGGAAERADHVIVTVSLGVLKAGLADEKKGLAFAPALPSFKVGAIGRLGFGLVNKLFLKLEAAAAAAELPFPFLELAFDQEPGSRRRAAEIPWWMRRTASVYPIYGGARVLLAWFSGREALELETLDDDDIVDGVNATLDAFSPGADRRCNGTHAQNGSAGNFGRVARVMRSRWRSDPLFLGSYSYVAIGSSGDDLDLMAEPLPRGGSDASGGAGAAPPPPPLQILFAGEATHRTHYSTTHGAYFSGIREAERLIQHYSRCHVSKEEEIEPFN